MHVNDLRKMGHSVKNMTGAKLEDIIAELTNPTVNFYVLSPEDFAGTKGHVDAWDEFFTQLHAETNPHGPSFTIVLDEVHYNQTWGLSFRPAFKEMGTVLAKHPRVLIVGFSCGIGKCSVEPYLI